MMELRPTTWGFAASWAVSIPALSIPAGIGGGLLGGFAMGEKGARYGAALGLTWGFLTGAAPFPFLVEAQRPPLYVAFLWGLTGLVCSSLGVPLGLRIGRWGRPVVLVFEDIWPYLSEMAVPFGGFVSGYLALILIFAGLMGTTWRMDPSGSFSGFSSAASFWDFAYFSVAVATGSAESSQARSSLAKLFVSAEAIFAQGWMIAVFAAVGAHLTPRFEKISEKLRTRTKSKLD